MSSERSAVSARMMTLSSCSSIKPPESATSVSSPCLRNTSGPGLRAVIRGACSGRTVSSPSLPGRVTESTPVSSKTMRSGVMICRLSGISLGLRRQGLGLLQRHVDGTHVVEGLLGQSVVLAFEDLLATAHRFSRRDVLSGSAGEDFSDKEGLSQEALDAPRAGDRQLVFVRKLVDAEDGDDVLQVFVALQGL